MSQKQYKKTYEGDYTKSYRDHAAWAKEAAQKRQEYQSASKKADSTSYNKAERSEVYDITGRRPKESERVYAEGGRRSSTTAQQANKRSTPVAKPKPATTPTSPPSAVSNKGNAPTQVHVEEDDGNYNFYNPPIIHIGNNKYRNQKTNKEIGVDEARRVLKLAGYIPKEGLGIGSLIFTLIIAHIMIPSIAPFAAMVYGIYRIFSTTTTWAKHGGSKLYNCNLPTTPEESNKNKNMGQICIGVGLFLLIFRYHHLVF